MRKALFWSLVIFFLLFPLAWFNGEVYATARQVAQLKNRVNQQRRSYSMAVAQLAAQDRLSVVQDRAIALGMAYPEGIVLEENQMAGNSVEPVGPDHGRTPDLAAVVGR